MPLYEYINYVNVPVRPLAPPRCRVNLYSMHIYIDQLEKLRQWVSARTRPICASPSNPSAPTQSAHISPLFLQPSRPPCPDQPISGTLQTLAQAWDMYVPWRGKRHS